MWNWPAPLPIAQHADRLAPRPCARRGRSSPSPSARRRRGSRCRARRCALPTSANGGLPPTLLQRRAGCFPADRRRGGRRAAGGGAASARAAAASRRRRAARQREQQRARRSARRRERRSSHRRRSYVAGAGESSAPAALGRDQRRRACSAHDHAATPRERARRSAARPLCQLQSSRLRERERVVQRVRGDARVQRAACSGRAGTARSRARRAARGRAPGAEPTCTPPNSSPVISAAGSVPRQLRSAVKM